MSVAKDTNTNDSTTNGQIESDLPTPNGELESTGRRAFLGSTGFVGSLAAMSGAAMGGAAVVETFSAKPAHAQSAKSSLSAIWRSEDVAFLLIDYQPEMFANTVTMNPKFMELNVRLLCRMAKALDIPTVLSTVGVGMGFNEATQPSIRKELSHLEEIDRTTMNAWEDANFRKAVDATGKKKLVILGLYTEICLTFPVIQALAEGYEVGIVADAVGGTNHVAHNMGIERMVHAGAVPMSTASLATELFRDWATEDAKKIGPAIDWYFEEYSKGKFVDVFQSPK